jgi:ferredoxin-NADP reductase
VEVFICGPGPMMDAVEKALIQLGVPMGDFHSERFDMV